MEELNMFGKIDSLEKLKNGMEMTAFTSFVKEADATKIDDILEIARVEGQQVESIYFFSPAIYNIVKELKMAGLCIYINDYQKYICFDSIVDSISYRAVMEYEGMVSVDPESDFDEIEFFWRVEIFKR